MNWREIPMAEAVAYCDGRKVADPAYFPGHCLQVGNGVLFTDGTALTCKSEWSGPLSEVTPDVDGEPPRFFLGTPEEIVIGGHRYVPASILTDLAGEMAEYIVSLADRGDLPNITAYDLADRIRPHLLERD